jgi:hypothetical protein
MNEKTPPENTNVIDLHVTKAFENLPTRDFLAGVFASWEKSRMVTVGDDGVSKVVCSDDSWAEINRALAVLMGNLAAEVLKEIVPPLQSIFFAQGEKAGVDATTRKLSKIPYIKAALAPPMPDSEALVKSIGEEIRKAFEAGQASGKGTASEAAPRVASARQTVQRNQHTGEIMATVVNYQYEDAPGIQPPPL